MAVSAQYKFAPGLKRVAGYFYTDPNGGQGIRAYFTGSLDLVLSIIVHECTHMVIHSLADKVPTWFNEGMAVFFESAQFTDKGLKLQTIPFSRLWYLKRQLSEGEVLLSDLVQCPQSSYDSSYYPRGWSLIYYLFYAEGGKRQKQLYTYFTLLAKQRGMDDPFKQAFGLSASDLQKDWQEFIAHLEPATVEENAAAATFSITTWLDLERAQIYAAAAREKTVGRNETVLLVSAQVALAVARFANGPAMKEGAAKAVEYFEKLWPLAKDGKLAPLKKPTQRQLSQHLEYGRALLLAGQAERAQEVAELVLAADPYSGDAYALLAAVALEAEDPALHDLSQAKENAAIAADLGASVENNLTLAHIALAENQSDKGEAELRTTYKRDQFGLTGQLARFELYGRKRAAAAKKKAAEMAQAKLKEKDKQEKDKQEKDKPEKEKKDDDNDDD